jgi:hypothetical protein
MLKNAPSTAPGPANAIVVRNKRHEAMRMRDMADFIGPSIAAETDPGQALQVSRSCQTDRSLAEKH